MYRFELRSLRPLNKGSELTISYGEAKPNNHLLRDYGFIISGNEWDRVDFEPSSRSSSTSGSSSSSGNSSSSSSSNSRDLHGLNPVNLLEVREVDAAVSAQHGFILVL